MNTQTHRQQHHKALEQIMQDISPSTTLKGISIWRTLRQIEYRAHKNAEGLCNGELDQDTYEDEKGLIENRVTDLFGQLPKGFFVNGDPRGYALKLEPNSYPYALERDWGGYQILAAEID